MKHTSWGNKEITPHSRAANGAGERTEIWLLPQIPYALPGRYSQSRWNEGRGYPAIVGYRKIAVYNWARRYGKDGIAALREKGSRGPKPLMTSADTAKVKEAVRKHRESIKTAKAVWQEDTEREVSDSTFRRFLGLLVKI
ncbi:MAG: helix-turn-helix domain-containing protein [Bacteroides sp.]|nr:helix-turn-helix domain-containing protein [Bacteroides sp.]